MDPRLPPDFTGFEHRHATVGRVRLHYVEGGREHGGRPLVLVHGWPQHFGMWREIAEALVADHHVIAVDLRGHGWSDAPAGTESYDKRVLAGDLEGFVRALGLDRPVLVGHDWGGWTSLLVASRARVDLAGVVAIAIVAPWTPLPPTDLWRFAYQAVAGGPLGRFAHRHFGQRFLRTVFALGAGKAPKLTDTETYLERFRDPARAAAGTAMYRSFLLHEMPIAGTPKYAEPVTELPILLLPGRHDAILTPRLVTRAARTPNIEVEVIEDAGHWVPEQRPHVVVEKVRWFLGGLD